MLVEVNGTVLKSFRREKGGQASSGQVGSGQKVQLGLQKKSTLEATLLLLVIVSRIVNSCNRFRSFPQPESAPRKAFTQKEFIELSPSVIILRTLNRK